MLAFGSEVLVCCNGNLLAYDKSDQAVRTIDKFTGLHDKQIKHMTYAPDVQTAVLLYANNNSWTSSNNNCSARASFLRLWFRNKRTLRQWKHQQSSDYTATNQNRPSVYLVAKAKFSAGRR